LLLPHSPTEACGCVAAAGRLQGVAEALQTGRVDVFKINASELRALLHRAPRLSHCEHIAVDDVW